VSGPADTAAAAASTLNQLIQTCKDAEQGFQSAAAGVDDLNLQHLLESYSRQRGEFAAELQLEVERLAQEPAQSGHLAASLHRGWINIKSVVSGREESAIIAECERGEEAAVKTYEEAFMSALPQDLRAVVERQFMKIKEAQDQIRSLEEVHSRHH
jgi:uncharacterized protein (TIGR02284 family)